MDADVGELTVDEKLWCLDGDLPFWAGLADLARGGYHKRPFPAARIDRVGFPGFAFSDGPRGVVIGPATCFPVSMARGATWDVDLEERIGDAIGQELRAVGATLYGGVCVNVLRHPAWGRAQETYGEDPHHVGELGAALTRGVQRHAMACVKHFACNSMENARFKVDVTVDEAALHEVFLPHFRRIVDEGVAVVMSAYNAVNGEWCGESRSLLTDVLRDEWGFEGFVISDWIFGLRDATTSLVAGLDVEMPYRMIRANGLDPATVDWEAVDRSVARVIGTVRRFAEVLDREPPGPGVLACPAHRALAREAAAKSVVLLRNEGGLLPLDAGSLRRVAVVGELAAARNLGDGGSSDVWAPEAVTILDGLRAALPGASFVDDPAGADVAVVVVGFTKADEGEYIGVDGTSHLSSLYPGPDDPALVADFEARIAADPGPEPPPGVGGEGGGVGFAEGGDRRSLRLRPEHEELIRATAAANPRTVVVLVGGSAVLVSPWLDAVTAVVQAWYGGMEAGHGLADVLLGAVDATGRLPCTIPTDEAHLPPWDPDADAVVYDAWHGWWRLERDGNAPQFPFGFGLSYTTWAHRGAAVAVDGDALRVDVTVANTGDRPGADVVQVYGDLGPNRPRRLIGFARVEVDPGDAVLVSLRVPFDRFAVRDVDAHAMVVLPGTYEVAVARHAADPGAARFAVELPAHGGRHP